MGYPNYIEVRNPVSAKTAAMLDAECEAPYDCIEWPGKGKFERDDGKWYKITRKKDNWASHHACLVFGDFNMPNGHNFFLARYPTDVSWSKKIVPAMKRVIKKFGSNKNTYFNVDLIAYKENYNALEEFDSFKKAEKYDYKDGEFVKIEGQTDEKS